MNNADELKGLVVKANELLCHERAAIEVYSLAVTLLGRDLGSPDYDALLQLHQDRADRLIELIQRNGAEPRLEEVGWNRPRSAVLCAATLYDSEPPQGQLREFESEIDEACRKAAELLGGSSQLGQLLGEDLFVAGATLELLDVVGFPESAKGAKGKRKAKEAKVPAEGSVA